jgi:CheY-like chemotaxis protein
MASNMYAEVASGKDELLQILLAEDNPADVYLIREALKEHHIECNIVALADGREVLNALFPDGDAWVPDLIILDLNLPRHDGSEILAKIRSSEAGSRVPVVILTSSDSPRDREAAIALGASAYVSKPSNLDEFLKLGSLFKEMVTGAKRKSA